MQKSGHSPFEKWPDQLLPPSLQNGQAVIAGGAALARLPVRVDSYLYESGSGESDGLANSFLSSEPIGTLRFNPFGGIFCVNHLS